MSQKLEDILHRAAAAKTQGRARRPRPRGGVFARLADLYARMDAAYADAAQRAGLSCAGCEHNCCSGFFRHHTRIEWAYLWRGLNTLPARRLEQAQDRAERYVRETSAALRAGGVPALMCPLNDNGLCALYFHRLMICRLHGTRNTAAMPDGRIVTFPGCRRFVALRADAGEEAPALDRTPFYRELAALELDFCRAAPAPLPGVDLTIAQMIAAGPPKMR